MRVEASRPSSSCRSTQTVSSGASMPAARLAVTTRGAGIGQFAFGAAPDHVDVEREVAGAEGAMLDPRAGAEDRFDLSQALGGLDDRDQVDRAGGRPRSRSRLPQQPVDRLQGRGAFDLGQDDAVEPGAHDRGEIAVAEFGVGGVDPDIEEALAGRLSAAATMPRVAGFSAIATASSRSRITASASRVSAFSTRRGWLPGANSRVRSGGVGCVMVPSLFAHAL